MEKQSTLVRGRTAATWALGSLAVFFFVVEAITGLGLVFHYRPTLESAYGDVLDLSQASGFGWVRKVHYWGSHALIVVVWLHLLRTFISGSYRSGRRQDWTVGVVLLVAILMLAATGAKLPMDTHAASSADHSPSLGDARSESAIEAPDAASLRRAFILHCLVLPALATALVVVHSRRARRDSTSTPHEPPKPEPTLETVREDAVREDAVREDAVREDAVQEDAVREDAV